MPRYSKIGYGLRRATREYDDPHPGALHGKTVMVTGASSGLGGMEGYGPRGDA